MLQCTPASGDRSFYSFLLGSAVICCGETVLGCHALQSILSQHCKEILCIGSRSQVCQHMGLSDPALFLKSLTGFRISGMMRGGRRCPVVAEDPETGLWIPLDRPSCCTEGPQSWVPGCSRQYSWLLAAGVQTTCALVKGTSSRALVLGFLYLETQAGGSVVPLLPSPASLACRP